MKKKVLILVIIVSALLIVAAGAVVYAKINNGNPTTTAQPQPATTAPQPSQNPPATTAAPLSAKYAPTTKTMSNVRIYVHFESDNCFIELTNETDKNLVIALSISFNQLLRKNPGDDRGGLTFVLAGGAPIENISLSPKGVWKYNFAVPKNYRTSEENDLTKLYYEVYLAIRK